MRQQVCRICYPGAIATSSSNDHGRGRFEHNYGHGEQHLTAVLASQILLPFLAHTVLGLCDRDYRAGRAHLPTRRTFLSTCARSLNNCRLTPGSSSWSSCLRRSSPPSRHRLAAPLRRVLKCGRAGDSRPSVDSFRARININGWVVPISGSTVTIMDAWSIR